MAKLQLKQGTTSKIVYIFIQDSSVTTGAGLTGLAFNTSNLVAYYVQPGGSATAITLATQTITGAYSSGGFVEVSSSNMPGVYRLDIPNAALTGATSVLVMLKGATNMVPCLLEIELTATDNQTASTGGITNLDAAISTRLASASYTTPPTANENADALLDRSNGVETGLTPRGALRLALAALAGVLSGAETSSVTIKNAVANSKTRITATVDASGNRSVVNTDTT